MCVKKKIEFTEYCQAWIYRYGVFKKTCMGYAFYPDRLIIQ